MEIYRRAVELWIKEKKRLEYDDLPEYLKTHNNRTAFVDRFKVVAADLLSKRVYAWKHMPMATSSFPKNRTDIGWYYVEIIILGYKI